MRIVAGEHRSRILEAPKDNAVRPTSDKVRGAVFNMLESRGLVRGAVTIDGFCGTGALGLEALSRGADFCTFIDNHKNSIDLTKRNIANLKEEQRSRVLVHDVTKLTKNSDQKADLIFLDPPYGKNLIEPSLAALASSGWLAKGAYIVVEESQVFITPSDFTMLLQKQYGDTQVTLLAYASQPE